jgi:hypothetical protein
MTDPLDVESEISMLWAAFATALGECIKFIDANVPAEYRGLAMAEVRRGFEPRLQRIAAYEADFAMRKAKA